MARTTTLKLTAQESALLFGMVEGCLTEPTTVPLNPAQRRIANALRAKVTAALIATQRGES